MKSILMNQLKKGDIFCYEVKLHNRKSFEVIEEPKPESKTILCNDRVENKTIEKSKKGYVILLRTVNYE